MAAPGGASLKDPKAARRWRARAKLCAGGHEETSPQTIAPRITRVYFDDMPTDPAIPQALGLAPNARPLAIAQAVADRTKAFALADDPPRSHVRYLAGIAESLLDPMIRGHADFERRSYESSRDVNFHWGWDDNELVETAKAVGVAADLGEILDDGRLDFIAWERLERELRFRTRRIAMDLLLSLQREGVIIRDDKAS